MKQLYYEDQFTDENGEFLYETNPVKAIRNKCKYDCCCGDQDSWKNCTCTKCFLYPFRLGHNPFRKQIVRTDEQKAELVERINMARSKKLNIL